MTARIKRQRHTVELTNYLRVTLLELNDKALLPALKAKSALWPRSSAASVLVLDSRVGARGAAVRVDQIHLELIDDRIGVRSAVTGIQVDE